MNFKELLLQAKNGDLQAVSTILCMYRPLLLKQSVIDGTFDEDLFQELSITILRCIETIKLR